MRVVLAARRLSLNNLLVSETAVSVIDFDEFGGTLVPLHDAFGLALSVPLSQSDSCPLSFAECVALSSSRRGRTRRWTRPTSPRC